ncbi:MAG: pre-peptidase C-terminal domain-containing protein, partial [Rhodothermales bacterium]|nr:pre-peptidase C-terminal domain-containing protein [Rhodothermales bacterium]
MTPASANPYVSYLPAGVEPDYRYWKARTALESYRRAERRGELAPRTRRLTVYESEAVGATGTNDTYATADFARGFGTGPDDLDPVVTLSGYLTDSVYPVDPALPFAEDDGAIPLASPVALAVGEGVRIEGAAIGDGPFGATSGDFDFYAVTATTEGLTLVANVDVPGDLDAYLALYDEAGTFIAVNNDTHGTEPFLDLRLPAPGTYYVAVFGYRSGVPILGDPFDAGSGPGVGSTGAYDLTLAFPERDVDVYAFDLDAGDVLGVGEGMGFLHSVEIVAPDGTVMIGSRRPLSFAYPADSPLPSEGGPGIGASTVAHEAGTYYLAVTGNADGPYSLGVHAFRPRTETESGATQVIFVDFDGATINAEEIWGGNANAVLSPLADFVPDWGLEPDDEDALIDAILAVLEQRLHDHLLLNGNNPGTGVVLRNRRDHADPGDAPYVSRLIVGGTMLELGIQTVGIASTIDPGNFGLEDVGVTLLDILSASPGIRSSLNGIEMAPGADKLDLVAVGVGGITAHEAG